MRHGPLAAVAHLSCAANSVDDTTFITRLNVVPYLMIVFLWVIVLVAVPASEGFSMQVLLVGGLVLTMLVFVRQLTTQHEVRRLMTTYHLRESPTRSLSSRVGDASSSTAMWRSPPPATGANRCP